MESGVVQLQENPGRTKDLFQRHDLIHLIIPLIIEQAFMMSVGMFDTIMVASAGESAVSGVALVESLNILMINLFTALANGGAIVAGQYLGKRDEENSSHAAKQLVISVFFISVCIMLPCLLFNRPLLSVLFGSIEADVMSNARAYFYVTALSYPFIALYNAAGALFRSMGNSKTSMFNALIMNLLNIGGNALFIYGFGLGALGAGISTTISRIVAAATMLWMLRNPNLRLSVRNYHFKDLDFTMIKRILRIGIPNGLENSMFQFGRLIVTSLVAVYSTTAITAHSVALSVTGVAVIPGMALGMALTTVVAQCVGAGEYDQATRYIKRLMAVAYGAMILLNAAILICLNPILAIYKLSPETAEIARQLLFFHGFAAMTIWPASFSLPNAFRAAGDVRYTMVVSILSMWIFRVGCSYLLAYVFNLGVISVWYAMVIDWIARAVCFLWRYGSGRWKKKAIA